MCRTWKSRLLAFMLAVCSLFSLCITAQASSLADGSKTCSVDYTPRNFFLTTTSGTSIRAGGYTYTTNDNISGAAYCIDHGLAWTDRKLPIVGKYTASPATAGAFANGYPQHSVETFLGLYLAENAILSGLTDEEFMYATQIAVWATLGQLGVDGTPFTSGREYIQSQGDNTQAQRVFRAAQLICNAAKTWDRVYQTGMYIRLDENALGGNIAIPNYMTLEYAAANNQYGLKCEVINGKSYYTREYIFASATSTYYNDYSMELWATGCPDGTIFTDMNNVELPRSHWRETSTWRCPTEYKGTALNYNGFEYRCKAKLCIPVDTVTNSGEITLHCAASIMQYEIFLAENEDNTEQSYIVADPSKGAMEADAVLSWGSKLTEDAYLYLSKVDGTGNPLAGATFTLTGSDGSRHTATTNAEGKIFWNDLNPNAVFTLTEDEAPAGYTVIEPRTLTVKAAQITYITVQDTPQHTFSIHKVDQQTGYSLQGAVIRLEQINGSFVTEKTTDSAGFVQFNADTLPLGSYRYYEVVSPKGYELDRTVRTFNWDGTRDVTLTIKNVRKPTLVISKKDSETGYNLPGASFAVYKNGSLITTVTTGDSGLAYVHDMTPGYWEVRETVAPEGYTINTKVFGVNIDPYNPATTDDPRLVVTNAPLITLTIQKHDADTDEPVEGTVFQVKKADGNAVAEVTTGKDGSVIVSGLLPGVYEIVEKSVPSPYLLDAAPQTVTLVAGTDRTVHFENHKKPHLAVCKVDSITGDPLQGAKFQVWYGSNHTGTGELNDLGIYYTDANGRFSLTDLKDGWYKVSELEPKPGYGIKDPTTQEFYLTSGTSKTITFENTPLSALVVWKYDSVTGAAVGGAVFRVRYLSGTSGTGGTVIGTYKTSANGSFTVTGLKAGTFVVEEVASDEAHVIDTPPQTAYISGKEQDVVQLYFGNAPKASLTVKKIDSVTHAPLSGVEFLVTMADGSYVGSANGKYTTDSTGSFTINGLASGSALVVKETRAKPGYLLDDTAQTITLSAGQAGVLEFRNAPMGNLIIRKLDSVTHEPLAGVQFKIVYADGSYVDAQGGTLSSNGIYYTNKSGQISLSGIVGTVVVTEEKSIDGYTINENTRSQTVTVNPNDTQTLTFFNDPVGGVEIIKVSSADRSKRIANVTFEIRKADGAIVDTVTTDKNGRVRLNLEDGAYYAVEVDCPNSYKLDSTPHYFTIQNGRTVKLTITNEPFSGILIHKTDSTTGKGISGVTFLLYNSSFTPIGQYTSSQNGYVYIDDLPESGRYYLRELENTGYVPDTQMKTVYVTAGETSLVEWKNTPITGQIQVVKKSADYNSITGLPAGTLLEGAVFEVYNERTGAKVDTITSGANGLAVSKPLPLGRYIVREVKAPANYAVNTTEISAVLEYSGQIVRFEVTNKSVSVGVAITKTGPKEAVSGQPVRYVFGGISNTGNMTLDSFYWRDMLPSAVTLDKVVTGTYNFPGSYKVVYKVNNTGGYRTLADNLSTGKNYTLTATPAALGLAANEKVTEVMFVFGQAPGSFAQVEAPAIYCTAVKGLSPGSVIVNTADVGGVYNGAWVQAVSRWETKVYGKPTPLPRTGY